MKIVLFSLCLILCSKQLNFAYRTLLMLFAVIVKEEEWNDDNDAL